MTLSRRLLPSAALLLVAACGSVQPSPPYPTESVRLPPDAVIGAGDPVRLAVANTSSVFSSTRPLANRPSDAAEAIAQMEFLAVALPGSPVYREVSPMINVQMFRAKQEWRGVLGIPADVPAQRVVNQLYAAARALNAGNQAAALQALSPPTFTFGPEATLATLSRLPLMPFTNESAVAARGVLERSMGRGRF